MPALPDFATYVAGEIQLSRHGRGREGNLLILPTLSLLTLLFSRLGDKRRRQKGLGQLVEFVLVDFVFFRNLPDWLRSTLIVETGSLVCFWSNFILVEIQMKFGCESNNRLLFIL